MGSIAARWEILRESFQLLDACQQLLDEDSAFGVEKLIKEAEAFIHVPPCFGSPSR